MKTFVSPESWFSFDYPDSWFEFEEESEDFLFYNPDNWSGNFRISAYRGGDNDYGRQCMDEELRRPGASLVKIGSWKAVQTTDRFTEEGASYVGWYWTIGQGSTCVECSFVAPAGTASDEGRKIVETLVVNAPGVFFKDKLVTLRLAEITEIDEAYNWVEKLAKKGAKARLADFQKGVQTLQQLIDSGEAKQLGRDAGAVLGITLCALMAEESDDFEWKTLVDGRSERAVLVRTDGKRIDPEKLIDPAHADVMAVAESLLQQN
jgi:hypothetical protein